MERILLLYLEDGEIKLEFGTPEEITEIVNDITGATEIESIEMIRIEFDEYSGAALDIAWGLEEVDGRTGLRTLLRELVLNTAVADIAEIHNSFSEKRHFGGGGTD